ncbi:uncharacterized protein BP01DRAFT_61124 [Aspergillus saccharolyticus JOP 1030-1]|uniref:Uncharacterized protein n=1 Tax=Aspergillus saccharolyticus JOP 1030-1 TaxID=1450539 RepID=A0A318ZC04_9EURO|nr:hypothetical protein BP01DRAFT_61124 [Aspergillus saccharolyticus JOP 1030-1]PYH44936.1 hypothetical protein BP01DRAFT_61124 [Aspergillus saccharolyticus JOP 1030-1]
MTVTCMGLHSWCLHNPAAACIVCVQDYQQARGKSKIETKETPSISDQMIIPAGVVLLRPPHLLETRHHPLEELALRKPLGLLFRPCEARSPKDLLAVYARAGLVFFSSYFVLFTRPLVSFGARARGSFVPFGRFFISLWEILGLVSSR